MWERKLGYRVGQTWRVAAISTAHALLSLLLLSALGALCLLVVPLAYADTSGNSSLYEQINDSTPDGIAISSPGRTADDFVVPTDMVWTVSVVDVAGTSIGGQLPTSMSVSFYADAGGVPGTLVGSQQTSLPYMRLVGVVDAHNGATVDQYDIPLATPIALPSGHYWVSVQGNGTRYGFGWEEAAPQANNPAVIYGCSVDPGGWIPLERCYTDYPDLAFRLVGTASEANNTGSGGGEPPTATPELPSGELLATGLLPIGGALLYRRRANRRAPKGMNAPIA